MIEISHVLILNLHFQIVDQVSRSKGKPVQYNCITTQLILGVHFNCCLLTSYTIHCQFCFSFKKNHLFANSYVIDTDKHHINCT